MDHTGSVAIGYPDDPPTDISSALSELFSTASERQRNRQLCERFPFLIPSNRWSGKRITEASDGGYWPGSPETIPEYDYEFTELDDMPSGWRTAFGETLCSELKEELEKHGALDRYRIVQIKEKYGQLRWYDNGNTETGYKIINKYTELSERTCICCGKPATRITTWWISPYCDDCVPKNERSVPIEDWFKE